MNSRKSLYDVGEFYRKNAILNASFQGMRYRIMREAVEENECLVATVWPEPYCFEKTAEEQKEQRRFPCTEEGLDAIYDWLCSTYEQEKEHWEHARDYPMEGTLY